MERKLRGPSTTAPGTSFPTDVSASRGRRLRPRGHRSRISARCLVLSISRASAHIAELVQPIRAKPLSGERASPATRPIRRNSPVSPTGRADHRSPYPNAAGQRLGPSPRAIDAVQPTEFLHEETHPWNPRVRRGPSRSHHPGRGQQFVTDGPAGRSLPTSSCDRRSASEDPDPADAHAHQDDQR